MVPDSSGGACSIHLSHSPSHLLYGNRFLCLYVDFLDNFKKFARQVSPKGLTKAGDFWYYIDILLHNRIVAKIKKLSIFPLFYNSSMSLPKKLPPPPKNDFFLTLLNFLLQNLT